MTPAISVNRKACARIPTDAGEFTLCLYHNSLDEKEHLALIVGEIGQNGQLGGTGQNDVLVRVHSECFTGDVLGSRRCDCGQQLVASMELIAREGRGIILYMRQEGRGIGLLGKLRAYNLQDMGYDTVDANLLLGHQPDLRDYRIAAQILKDLEVTSVRLLTNNPDKIAGLERCGLTVMERVPLETPIHAENAGYMNTKVHRMRHLLELDEAAVNGYLHTNLTTPLQQLTEPGLSSGRNPAEALRDLASSPPVRRNRPYITLSFAQSLDGSIAAQRGEPTPISGPEAMRLTHQMRAGHDAILVGIGTVMADDPRLTVRLVNGPNPQRVVIDSRLRFPPRARMLEDGRPPWIITTDTADPARQVTLEVAGARVFRLPSNGDGLVSLKALVVHLGQMNVRSLMVEGGATVIKSFLAEHLADRLVVTIAPMILGGLSAVGNLGQLNGKVLPRLARPHYYPLGRDMIMVGDLEWD